ncbi:MAG: response regulator [Magnetococcus sp. WYHC-3]
MNEAPPAPLIVLIEDEPQIRRFVRMGLAAEGYGVVETVSAAEGILAAGTRRPDGVIVDLGLPDRDGLEVIRDLRTWSRMPILVLSARNTESDKVAALDQGADDYLTKPFGMPELLARLRALLRRSQQAPGEGEPTLRLGDVDIDLTLRQVSRSGVAIHLTALEYRLLTLLVANAGRVLTHQHLLREVWGRHQTAQVHYLRVYMSNLRRKLEHDPNRPVHLLTVSGVGYRLVL